LPPAGADLQLAWDALNDLLAWKLAGASGSSLKLTDDSIGRSIAQHLRPLLFESGTANASEALRNLGAFHALMSAQIELNEFNARSVDAFCYDDSIRFERRGDRLEIVEVEPAARTAWQNDGLKLASAWLLVPPCTRRLCRAGRLRSGPVDDRSSGECGREPVGLVAGAAGAASLA
jgi:hypothetical protein